MSPHKIRTCLWFDGDAEEAMNLYVSLFRSAKVLDVTRNPKGAPAPEGSVLVATFELEGQQFMALNGGPEYHFTEAISLSVDCTTQDEVDELWDRLTADGGEPGQCGWLKDRFGLSWQIVPRALTEMLGDPDRERAARVMQAMLPMRKLDIERLTEAYEGR